MDFIFWNCCEKHTIHLFLLLRVVFGWKERKHEAQNKIRCFMKSMEIGSKQKYAHKQFLRGCFAVYHFEVGIICFNVVVFPILQTMSNLNIFVSTLNLITLRTYFSSFSRKKFNDSFFAPCLEHKLVFWFCHRHILRYYLHLGKHYGFFGNCLDHFWNGNMYDHHRN